MDLPIDLFLHVDRHLAELVARHGAWVYGILFLVVFAETGLVVLPDGRWALGTRWTCFSLPPCWRSPRSSATR